MFVPLYHVLYFILHRYTKYNYSNNGNNNDNKSSFPFFTHALRTLLVLIKRNAHASMKQLAKKSYPNRKFSLKENKTKKDELKKKVIIT